MSSYLDSPNGTIGNAIYWCMKRLEPRTIGVLRGIGSGTHPYVAQRFEVAYLLSLDCVQADHDARTLTITDKGRDCLAWWDLDATASERMEEVRP